jgi:hypothetical protein
MNMYIEKNILLDNIIKLNDFLLTYQNSLNVNEFVEILDNLRHNFVNQNEESKILYDLVLLINNIYSDTQLVKEMIYNKYDLNLADEILYGLYNSKLLILKHMKKLESADSLDELVNELAL